LNQELFSEWLEDPVTEYFMKYLNDSIKHESGLIAESISGNSVISEAEQIRIGSMCVTLERISEIDFEEIEEFNKGDKDD
jgi:hypothetical protein